MTMAEQLSENSRQGFAAENPPCIGIEIDLSRNLHWGCGHVYDETPLGLAVYVRNDPVNLTDPDGRAVIDPNVYQFQQSVFSTGNEFNAWFNQAMGNNTMADYNAMLFSYGLATIPGYAAPDPTLMAYSASVNLGQANLAISGALQRALKETASAIASDIPPEVKEAIKNSVKASNSKSRMVGDTRGGYHEEGGLWGMSQYDLLAIQLAFPGLANMKVRGGANIDLDNPLLFGANRIPTIQGQWHVHPKGTATIDNMYYTFQQPPTYPTDYQNAVFPINIVVGARDKQVYFYNTEGVRGQMGLKDFLKP